MLLWYLPEDCPKQRRAPKTITVGGSKIQEEGTLNYQHGATCSTSRWPDL